MAFALIVAHGAAALMMMAVLHRFHANTPAARLASAMRRREQPRRRHLIVANLGLSALLYFTALLLLGDRLISDTQPFRWWTAPLVLSIQDFGYYWLHRCLHRPWLMCRIHKIHHRAAHPTVFDTVYMHPAEMAAAWALLIIAAAVVGPLNVWEFAAAAAGHAIGNVIAHSGLQFESALAAPLNRWISRHDAHHSSGGEFTVFLPIIDRLFNTRPPPESTQVNERPNRRRKGTGGATYRADAVRDRSRIGATCPDRT